MNIRVYSREVIGKLLRGNFPNNVAVISFLDPPNKSGFNLLPVDYIGKTDRIFQIELHDLDIDVLGDFDLTVDTYFPEVDKLAKFDHLDSICQCEYG